MIIDEENMNIWVFYIKSQRSLITNNFNTITTVAKKSNIFEVNVLNNQLHIFCNEIRMHESDMWEERNMTCG